LYRYEDVALCLYTKRSEEESLESSLKIVSDLENHKTSNDFCQLPRSMINPIILVKCWVKQEILDFEAVVQTINSKLRLFKC
jgi:hypothetical protein